MDFGFYSFLVLMVVVYTIVKIKDWIEERSYQNWKNRAPEFRNPNNQKVEKAPLQDPRIIVSALRKFQLH